KLGAHVGPRRVGHRQGLAVDAACRRDRLLGHDPAARAHGRAHPSKHENGIVHVHQEEATERQVHGLGQQKVLARLGDGHDLGVLSGGARHLVARRRVAVDGVHPAVLTDDLGQSDADIATPGAHVDALPTLAKPEAVESGLQRTPVHIVAEAELDHDRKLRRTIPAVGTDVELADELVDAVRTFVTKEVLPVASDYEHADEYPEPLVEQMKAMGLFGVTIPVEYGGLGLDIVTYARIVEEIAFGWMSLTGILNTHFITATLIANEGTVEQKERWLAKMATGELRGCLSLSEPDAGSDTRSLRCRATPDGDEYVLDGTKMWVTNGVRASLVTLAAKTPEGITCFIVEKEPGPSFGGITVSRTIPKLGYKGLETVEMSYSGHRVPASSVLGGPDTLGRGLPLILGALELGRI